MTKSRETVLSYHQGLISQWQHHQVGGSSASKPPPTLTGPPGASPSLLSPCLRAVRAALCEKTESRPKSTATILLSQLKGSPHPVGQEVPHHGWRASQLSRKCPQDDSRFTGTRSRTRATRCVGWRDCDVFFSLQPSWFLFCSLPVRLLE